MRIAVQRIVILAVILASWQGASLWFGAQWIPAPVATARALWLQVQNGELWYHARFTLSAAVIGFLIGGIPGAVLPFLIRRLATLRAILDPYLIAGYGAPKVALTPLFILWFGIGLESKVALVASVVFFLVFFITLAGLDSVDQKLIAAARVFGAGPALIAREIIWPGAIPYVFTGLRVAAPYAIGTAVVGELISSNRGLGYSIQAAATNFEPAKLFVGVVALAGIVLILNAVLDFCEKRLLSWRPTGGIAERAQTSF
ncbi:ABC transporter permease [Reyranella sp. CPCC 100927]|uniref:ABC transporter permease n=1 Tax=Reyranella sp. CPCC 100927 TaxID=2599616 RepID=UPI0011B7A6E1|nr:ABC transporter permease [Reyranella sp. CPCC 100927]TWT14099.1 ABC transporter permease [Reyranella sp. CPCC 100927]